MPFSWAEVDNMSTRTLGGEWVGAYREFVRRVGDRLPADGRFLESCAYLAPKLMRRARRVASFKATRDLFALPAWLFRALVDGAARRHADQSQAGRLQVGLFTPGGASGEYYREAWLAFVAGWENLSDAIVRGRVGEGSWAEIVESADGLSRHLYETALMVAQAALAEEEQAIGWTTDILLKWHDTVTRGNRIRHQFGLLKPLVTMGIIKEDWGVVSGLPIALPGEMFGPDEVFDAALSNAWVDTMVVLTSSLIGQFGEVALNGRISDGSGTAASAIFQNRSFDPGASAHPHNPPLTTDSILHSILRLVGAGSRYEEGYGSEIGSLAEQVQRLEGPNYVSARVYGWSGEADVYGQANPQLLLLAASMPQPGRRRGSLHVGSIERGLLLPEEDGRKRRILDHLRSLREAVGQVDVDRGRAIVATLRGSDCDAAELAWRLAAADTLLADCEDAIVSAREAQIGSAVIDGRRLKAVAEAASRTGFSKSEGGFPVRLFGKVEKVEAVLSAYSRSKAVLKGQYVEPPMEYMAGDEADHFDTLFRSVVGAVVFDDVTKSVSPTRRRPRSAASYWVALKAGLAAVRAAGQTPIIVREDRNQPAWLMNWLFHAGTRPHDMILENFPGQGHGYDFHLNGAPVYSSPWVGPVTWVMGGEILEVVEFQSHEYDLSTKVSFKDDPGNIWRGRLVLEFGRRVTVGVGPVWRISHG